MLRELSIRQFAIIEELELSFAQEGFHVLTGETGAGKSILIDALGLVAGGRASSEFVRHGSQKAEIEALFELAPTHPVRPLLVEWGLDEDVDILLIRREITANGKSTCRINGRMVTLAMLKQIGRKLIDISGQHEHQSLLHIDEHLEWLDQFGGEWILPLRRQYEEKYQQFQKIEKEIKRLSIDQKEIAQRMDLYQFQLEEIQSAQLVAGEDEELEREQNRLAHAEKLMSHTVRAYEHLYAEQGGLDHLQKALTHMEEIAEIDSSLNYLNDIVQSAYYQLDDVARHLGRYRDEIEFDPVRLNQVEERLHLIKQCKRKYGDTIEEILEYGGKIEDELERLTHRDEQETELLDQLELLRPQLTELAQELTIRRKKIATQLQAKVEQELADLNMGSTIFHVAFRQDDLRSPQLQATGIDQIEFLIAPNPGEPLRPLAKIASGGELSRIMLALKVIFTDIQEIHTLIFDEVDTGVSGRAAQAIAEKIAVLARNHQVLCVTHLPQVACMADHHLYIFKETTSYSTKTKVDPLDHEGRTHELARLLGGVEVTQKTREHAEEMLRLADQVKKVILS
ncbi:DNA repair protein RecN [Hazenella coriacea]|uniref:DNA repair protein RecN n=1 Tax=Hazenella coriacea TaxID=1179467 RepID=A0A4R3L9P3_9BACL|nr:DNA repair protein RecN [Hazenella coriacea]TCS96372.1 DNA replication and repair protein RecN [Hazenella coriacea]